MNQKNARMRASDFLKIWLGNRWWIPVICFALVLLSMPPAIPFLFSFGAPFNINGTPWSEEVKLIIEDIQESSRTFLQTAVSLMAAGWGVIVLKSANRKLLGSIERRYAFTAANICLIGSCISYLVLTYVICKHLQGSAIECAIATAQEPSGKIIPGSVPDLNSWYIQGYVWAQVAGLTSGAACLALTLVSNIGESSGED